MVVGLSEKQQQILEFIGSHIREPRRPPTNREIGKKMDIGSTGHIDYHLTALDKKGFLVRDPNTARGVRLTPEGEMALGIVSSANDTDDASGRTVIDFDRSRSTVRVPIHGRIAAGAPIEAISDPSDVIEVGLDIADDTSYALRVRGQSMVEDLIADGDIVIIRPGSTASNGDTVVALITSGSSEKGEATLKRFYREGNLVRLQPANQTMEPIYVRSEDLLVQGKVVALIRRI